MHRHNHHLPMPVVRHAVVAAGFCLAALPACAQSYSVLYAAPGTPGISNPIAQANAQGRDGNIYSTSSYAGSVAGGMFSISPTGTFRLVNDSIGGFVISGVTLGNDGNLYGTDQNVGGPQNCSNFSGCGQVFAISPAGVETVLYQFTNGIDGADPQAAPVLASNGKYYGTTLSSGSGQSVAYAVSGKGGFTSLHVFTSAEGQPVVAGLVQGSDGAFYGVGKSGGGSGGYGTVFKMTPAGKVTVLHSFTEGDGAGPASPLIQASNGIFYGTTTAGGSNGNGTVFSISAKGKFNLLYSFSAATDGATPSSSVMQATDGDLYGVTAGDGPAGGGTIYRLTTKGAFKVLYSFDSGNISQGYQPQSPLTQSTTGLMIGTTNQGGACQTHASTGCGVIYSLDVGLAPFVSLEETAGIEGSKIGILGQGFDKTTIVTFGGVAAAKVSLTGSTYLTATVPAGALSGPVVVTTGSQNLTSNTGFSVIPTLPSFSPSHGAPGTNVMLSGTGLTQTLSVSFGTTQASFQVVSDDQVTATVPSGAKTGKISVVTQGGKVTSKTKFIVN